jgi:DNA-binding PucR family transcriptional regulator
VLGPLMALPENDRAAVLETLEAFVEGSGSVAEVAAQTFRHRNTVRNRLQTVERVTGLSLSRPRDVAAITLAMAWRRGPVGRKDWD